MTPPPLPSPSPSSPSSSGAEAPTRWLLAVASAALPGWEPGRLCAAAANAGLRGVEWGAGRGQALPLDAPDRAVDALVRAAAADGLAACGLSVHDDRALESPVEVWERLAAAAVAVGAPHVRVYAPPVLDESESSGAFPEAFARLKRRIAEVAAVVAAVGPRLLLEPAPTTLVPDPVLAVRALSAADQDRVGVVYDPGSLAREGWLDPFLATDVLGPLLRHVHVKNASPVRGADGTWTWLRSVLDAGIVDWPRVFRALDRTGYEGWLVLDHLDAHTGESLASEAGCLRRLAEGGGREH